MALPITVPYTFGTATTAIPLSNLDSDYATVYQAVNGIGNGSVALANVSITSATVSGNIVANGTTGNVGQVLTSNASGGVYWSTVSGGSGGNVAIGLVRAISINCIFP